MSSPPLSVDPLWPRSGDWPALADVDADERIDLALLGIPTWRTSLSATGAAATPEAVRAALRYYATSLSPDRSAPGASVPGRSAPGASVPGRSLLGASPRPLGDLRFADAGDVVGPDGPDGEGRAIAAMADAVSRASVTVAVGGDNALTVPAALGAWGDGLATAGLVTLDAHHDLRDGVSNGSPVRRLIEAGLDGRRVVQVGIADFANSPAYAARAADYGITVIHRDELHRRPIDDVMAEALDIAGSGGGPVHVDLDVDVCDRSVAPGCPASVPGGIAAWELRRAARVAASWGSVRSVDIAEVDATADAPDGRTVRLAALLVLEVAAGLASR